MADSNNSSMTTITSIGCGCAGCESGMNSTNINPDILGDASVIAGGELISDSNLSVDAPSITASPTQFSNYLTDGFWQDFYSNGNTSSPWNSANYEGWNTKNSFTYSINGSYSNQASGIENAFDSWADVANVSFTRNDGLGSNADIYFDPVAGGESGRAFAAVGWSLSGGVASIGGSVRVVIDYGSGGFGSNINDYGDYALTTAIHEIGHALGLGHSGNYNAGQGNPSYSDATFTNDTHQFSLMSYWSETNYGGAQHFESPSTPMVMDILAIQNLYGVNTTTRTGNTTYGFNSNAGVDQFNFSINDNPVVAIWDAGGTDTLDLSGYSNTQMINLNDGEYSNVGGSTGNVAIAIGATIENAVGGSGIDTIYGNEANNVIASGNGNDIIHGSTGSDNINGGAGTDSVIYAYNVSSFLVNIINSVTVTFQHLSLSFTDTISYVETFILDSVSYTFAQLSAFAAIEGTSNADTLNGNDNANTINGLNGDDTIYAQGGDDIVNGGIGQDRVLGMAGNDTILGGAGNDVLLGNDGDDILYGEADHDQLLGHAGNDTLYGGAGNDDLRDYEGNDTIWGEDGNDVIYGGSGNDTYHGGNGDDRIYATSGENIINGNAGADVIYGGSDVDTINGGDDNDSIQGFGGNDSIIGGAGEDYIRGNDGNDTIFGGNDNDTLIGDDGDDTIYGQNGIDNINGGAGADTLFGDDGDDVLLGLSGNDTLHGGAGNDDLRDFDGNDIIYAGEGNDTIYGGIGNDTYNGNDGNDTIFADSGINTINGDAGEDILYGGTGVDTINGGADNDSIQGFDGDDIINGDAGADYMRGNNGNDTIRGGTGADTLLGDADNDILYGEDDNDILNGGIGNDTLYGGGGSDHLIGGSGEDTFVFESANAFDGWDHVHTFNEAEGDHIDISDLLSGYDSLSDALTDFVLLYEVGNYTYLHVDTDGGANSFTRVAALVNVTGVGDADAFVASGGLII